MIEEDVSLIVDQLTAIGTTLEKISDRLERLELAYKEANSWG